MNRTLLLIERLAREEVLLRQTSFLAPHVPNGGVRVRIAGIVQTLLGHPEMFEGWGIFRSRDLRTATLVEEAALDLVDRYLKLLPASSLLLIRQLSGKSWLALRAQLSKEDALTEAPVVVHLVDGGKAFDGIVARFDGAAWWFDAVNRRDDPFIADELRREIRSHTSVDLLRIKGISPAMRRLYALLYDNRRILLRRNNEERLRQALQMGGGTLHEVIDNGHYWTVEWSTPDDERHISAIGRDDLTVLSAGICLNGEDRTFDLQSLVGVVANA